MPCPRLWIALLGSAVLLTACERTAQRPPEPADETPAPELLPVAEPPLDRAELLQRVARAASDFAAGINDRDRQRRLDGRRFEVRLRFGCAGDDVETRRWSFDERSRVLRVRVEPELSATGPAVDALGLDPFEAVEGFWIRRPWLLEAACPVREPQSDGQAADGEDSEDAGETAPPQPWVGIAHFFTEQDSRTRRRDSRAYEATAKLDEGEVPSADGYDLVLTGRLRRLPDGRVIACAGDAANAPPRCLVSADFDGVRLVRPDGSVVADWSSG